MTAAITHLPNLHEALLLADHASPTPVASSGALRVLRAALADALAQTVSDLVVASKRYTPDQGSQLHQVITSAARGDVATRLLNGAADHVRVGPVSLVRDRAMNLIWGRDASGGESVAAIGTGPDSCERAATWALTAWREFPHINSAGIELQSGITDMDVTPTVKGNTP